MPRRIRNSFVNEQSGATAIEYGLIAALIAVVVIAAIAATGNATGILFNQVADRTITALTQHDL